MPAYSRILLPWDSQPQEVVELDRSNVITGSIRSLILPSIGPMDLVLPSRSVTKNANCNAAPSDDGIAFSSSDGNSGLIFSGGWSNVVPTTSPITFFARVYVSALGNRRVLFADWSAAGAAESIAFEATAANQWRQYSGGSLRITGGSVTVGWHTIVVSQAADQSSEVWVNGVSIGSSAVASSRAAGTTAAWLDSGAYAGGIGWNTNKASLMAVCEMYADIEIAKSFHDNPWQLFAPRSIWIPVSAGGGGISGTLATTNANDTSAASGTTTVLGTLARTNASDTSAASGTTTILGTVAATNGDDTAAASGTVGSSGSTGTVNYTNANDTAAATGTTTVIGTAAKSNADDSVSASGWVGAITGTLAATNANDTVSASGIASSGVAGGGGYLPSFRRKTRKEIHAERVRLGILPEQIRKAAKKVVEKAAEQGDPEEVYEDNTEKYKQMFLREVGATKWAPDYARAIRIQLELMERDAEDALLLM